MDKVKLTNVRKVATHDFLVAYELRKQMAQVDAGDIVVDSTPEEAAAAREECAKLVRPFDEDISVGQVRAISGTRDVTYVLVARQWDEQSWLVIPFSSFSMPATDTELKLKIDGGLGLRVVQLWNARSLLTETIAKSWLVHTLSDDDVADVCSAWQWSVGIGELTDDQLSRMGMPIMRRDDPRIEYEDAALANFAELDAADFADTKRKAWLASVQEAMGDMGDVVKVPFGNAEEFAWPSCGLVAAAFVARDYALAASDAEKAVSAKCRVGGFNGTVYIRYVPSTRSLNIRVFGVDGNRSTALDGWHVFGSGAKPLGVIDCASFECKCCDRFDGVLVLVDDEGNVYPLEEGK